MDIPKERVFEVRLTWEIRCSEISTIVLALEYENTYRVGEVLEDELQKLLDVNALLKVLIFYSSKLKENLHASDEKCTTMSLIYIKSESMIEESPCLFDFEEKM